MIRLRYKKTMEEKSSGEEVKRLTTDLPVVYDHI